MPSPQQTGKQRLLALAAGQPPSTHKPARTQTPSQTAMFVEDSAQEAGRRWDQGDVAGAIGAGARTAVGGVGMAAIEALDNTVGAAGRGLMDGAKKFAAGFAGRDAQAAEPEKSAPTSDAASEVASNAAPDAPADQSSTVTPLDETEAAKAGAPAAAQVVPGIYSHGKGQFSDRAGGMGFSDGFTGQPTAENDRLMQGLAGQSTAAAAPAPATNVTASPLPSAAAAHTATSTQVMGETGESAASPPASATKPRESWSAFTSRMMDLERGTTGASAGAQTPQMRSPTAVHSGNDWHARQALRRLQAAAGGIYRTKAEKAAAEAAYMKGMLADQAAIGGQPALDAEAMKANAALLREGMGQQGANSRAAIQEAGANRREGLRSLGEMAKFDRDAEEQGLRVRGMQRLDQAQEELLKAQSPAQVSSARARLLALHGKSGQEQTKWRSGNDREGNPFLYNETTAETRPMTAPAASQPPAEGSLVRGKDGFTYEVRNGVPVRIGG